MRLISLDRRERTLAWTLAALTLAAIVGPAVSMPDALANAFADGRSLGELPNALDVLSNLPFAALGMWGLTWLHRLDQAHDRAQATSWRALPEPAVDAFDCAWIFFTGLVVTAACSAFYHLEPGTLRLAADRAGMAVAFSGLIGFAVCERVSQRAGWPVAWATLGAGLLAVGVSHETGNILPWALLQFGGMLGVLVLSMTRLLAGAVGFKLGWVIFFYALAKLFELGDHAIYEATHHLISGHSVKHLVAALAALPVLHSLGALSRRALRHNRAAAAVTA